MTDGTQYKAVLFDLDGTLLNTIDDLADAMNAALAACGLPTRTASECKYFVGDGVRCFAQRALPPDRRDEATLGKIISLYSDAYSKNWGNKTRPYEGIPELLDALAARRLKAIVYSNKPDEFTNLTVRKLLAKWEFAAIVGARENFPNKPDPKASLDILGKLGLRPAEVVYVGDTGTDMQTATAAGMFAAGALWGFRTAKELLENGAKILLERPTDLIEHL
jgi:phosphoglycolate phosphatase